MVLKRQANHSVTAKNAFSRDGNNGAQLCSGDKLSASPHGGGNKSGCALLIHPTRWKKRDAPCLVRVLHLVAVVVRDERSDDAGGDTRVGGVRATGEHDGDLGPKNDAGC